MIYLSIAGTSPFLFFLGYDRCAKAELGWLEAAVQQCRPQRPAFSNGKPGIEPLEYVIPGLVNIQKAIEHGHL